MTDTEIIASIRDSGFPDDPDLSDAEVMEAIVRVKRDLKYHYPQIAYGSFTTYPGQQVYDLFNSVSDPSVSQGVFPGGISVLEVIFMPGGTDTGLSVFGIAPFLTGLTILPGEITVYSFNTPADWWIWDANWSSFIHRFGMQFFEHVTNKPGSPIRLFPVPQDTLPAWCRFKKYRDPLTFQSSAEDEAMFLLLVEAYAARVVARKLYAVAGTTIGSLKQDGKSALYWNMEADRKHAQGWAWFADHYYEVGVAAQRS